MMDSSFTDENSLFNFVVKDGNGVKGMVDLGLSEVPNLYIQPSHERIVKPHSTPSTLNNLLTPIDLSKLDGIDHDQVANEIANAAEALGFFQVVNHGVPLELLESLKAGANRFFEQAPEKKAVYRKGVSVSPYVTYGTSFVPEKEKALEWKDYVTMRYSTDDEARTHWPIECKDAALEYLNTSWHMVKKIMKILVEKLGVTLEESKLEGIIGMKTVSMNYYPTCPNPELTVGVGRHSDMGTLTVLLQDGVGGLYMKVEDDMNAGTIEEWIEIPPVAGALVINVADTLQVTTCTLFIYKR